MTRRDVYTIARDLERVVYEAGERAHYVPVHETAERLLAALELARELRRELTRYTQNGGLEIA